MCTDLLQSPLLLLLLLLLLILLLPFPRQQLTVMADDLVDKTFPYGEEAALAGAKFREVEALNSATGQVQYHTCIPAVY